MMGCFGCAGQPTEPKIESKAVVDDQPVVTSPRVRLSDGRFLAYRERGVPKIKSSYRIIIVHGFGSSKDMSFMASDVNPIISFPFSLSFSQSHDTDLIWLLLALISAYIYHIFLNFEFNSWGLNISEVGVN